ncbi:sirohydrochlorin chelatase [Streptomyces sp. NPDC088116]|uniref:sirohydrochlorin chelatase n=1 Tax=Streptomyces sp. NPDC088116 TaxID=3365825 RepID=UPI00382333FF
MTQSAYHRMPQPIPLPPGGSDPLDTATFDKAPLDTATIDSLPLDSAAQLFTRITAQLGHQLGKVARNGTRRSMHSNGPASAGPGPGHASAAGPSLVLVAHGSRDPRALRTITTLLERVRELRPGLDVRLGHIELNEPRLSDTLGRLTARGTGRAVLVPLLLSRGFHIKRDLPAAAASVPGLKARIAAPLGPHPLLVETLYARLVEAGWRTHATGSARTRARARNGAGVVLAAAGSRDPESAADTRRTAAQLSERLGGVPVVPAYASAASPTVAEALRALAARGRHRTAIASYFTAPGHFATRSTAAAPWIAAAPLGAHPAMARLLLHRYDEALATPYETGHRELASA